VQRHQQPDSCVQRGDDDGGLGQRGDHPPGGGEQPGRQRAEVDLLQRAGLDLTQQPPEHLGDLQVEEQERDHPHDQDRHPTGLQRPAQAAAGDLVAGAKQRAEQQGEADEQGQLDEDLDPFGPGVQQALADLVADRDQHAGHHGPSLPSRSARRMLTW